MEPDLESRVLALLRYALDNPGETFRRADGTAWLGEASELVRELEVKRESAQDVCFCRKSPCECDPDPIL